MEFLPTKTPKAFQLIRVLFYTISFVMFIALILLFVLEVYQTVKVNSGEIISNDPPIEYLAPFEGQIKEVFVTEGDFVSQGDTLVILENEALQMAFEQTTKEINLGEKNIVVYQNMIKKIDGKINYQKRQEGNIRNSFSSDHKDLNIELTSLANQIKAQEEKIDMTMDRLQKDYKLLQEGIISEQAYEIKRKAYLGEREKLTSFKQLYQQQRNRKANLGTGLSTEMNQQKLSVIDTEYERSDIEKKIVAEEIVLQQFKNKRDFEKQELDKRIVIAAIDGYVSALFNNKLDANFVHKGTPLLMVSPDKEQQFYAKMLISQESVREVVAGQQTHIKLDAYNYYKYGVLLGEVSFINRDTSNQFYVLANIPNQDYKFELKSGYKIKGEIITEKVKLYQFIFRKLFTQVDF